MTDLFRTRESKLGIEGKVNLTHGGTGGSVRESTEQQVRIVERDANEITMKRQGWVHCRTVWFQAAKEPRGAIGIIPTGAKSLLALLVRTQMIILIRIIIIIPPLLLLIERGRRPFRGKGGEHSTA